MSKVAGVRLTRRPVAGDPVAGGPRRARQVRGQTRRGIPFAKAPVACVRPAEAVTPGDPAPGDRRAGNRRARATARPAAASPSGKRGPAQIGLPAGSPNPRTLPSPPRRTAALRAWLSSAGNLEQPRGISRTSPEMDAFG